MPLPKVSDLADDAVDVESVTVGDGDGHRGWPTRAGTITMLPSATRLAMQLDVFGDNPGHVVGRRLEAKELLDGVGNQGRVLDHLSALVRMLGQHLGGPADEAVGGLVARARDHLEVGEQLLAVEPAGRARLVGELGVHQVGHQVVGGVLGAPVDVVGEDLSQ